MTAFARAALGAASTTRAGTRDGVIDEAGSLFNLVSGSFPITNSPGMAGSYVRYIRMFGPDHAELCESPHAAVVFQ